MDSVRSFFVQNWDIVWNPVLWYDVVRKKRGRCNYEQSR